MPEIPAWVRVLATPVWISDPDRRICYMNAQASRLFGRPAHECLGSRCYGVVQGVDEAGRPFCGECCLALCNVRQERELQPIQVRVRPSDERATWVRVLWIPLRAPGRDGVWLIHCALDSNREHHLEGYLRRVASRSSGTKARSGDWHKLTPREREILENLAKDQDLPTIAARCHVSHATVRNHVQHILDKTRSHSVQEVVARYLLGDLQGRSETTATESSS